MSVRKQFKAATLTAIEAELPTVQVVAGPPAENQARLEAVWISRVESQFEWRSLGNSPTQLLKNRIETIWIDLKIHVYREAPSQLDARAAAEDRCEDLIGEIELAIAQDPSVGDVVSFARLSESSIEMAAAESGWIADGRARFEATNHPT